MDTRYKSLTKDTSDEKQEKSLLEQLPHDVLIQILSFFSLKDMPALSAVSKQWTVTARDEVLKYLIMNTVPSLRVHEFNPRVDWKKLCLKIKERGIEYKNYEEEKKQVEIDEIVLQEARELNAIAVSIGVEPGYGVTRKDTCLAGWGVGAL